MPKFVAVGDAAKQAGSEDGYIWLEQLAGLPGAIYTVAWAYGVWLAAGNNDTAARSVDGENWSAITIGSTYNVWGFAHNGTTWVAVDGYGQVFTSSDGETWTLQSTPLDGANGDALYALAYDEVNGLFIAVGEKSYGVQGAIITSPDGTTWTERTAPAGYNSIACVAAGNGISVIGKTISGTGTGTQKLASGTTGTSWTPQTAFDATSRPLAIAHGNGFVAAGTQGKLYTSSDGVTWTPQISFFDTSAINGVSYSQVLERWVAVGGSGKLAASNDGLGWTLQITPFDTSTIWAVTSGGGNAAAFAMDAWVLATPRLYLDAYVLAETSERISATFLNAYTRNDAWDDPPLLRNSRAVHDRREMHFGVQSALLVELSSGIGTFSAGSTVEDVVRYLWGQLGDAEAFWGARFTLGAIARVIKTGSATLNAYIKAAFQLDAIVLVVRSGGITLNAIIKTTGVGSFTADAEVEVGPASFTLDAIVLASGAGSPTLDAIVRASGAGSLTLDANSVIRVAGTPVLDAWIKATLTGSFTLDASTPLGAESGLLGDHTLGRHELGGPVSTASSPTASFTADAIVLAVVSGTATVDAVVKATVSATFTLDASIGPPPGGFTADAIIKATVSGSFTLNAEVPGGGESGLLGDHILGQHELGGD